MGQYKIAKFVQESNKGWETTELARHFEVTRGAVDQSLRKLVQKGYLVKREDGKFVWNQEVDQEKIENIRPKSLSELDF